MSKYFSYAECRCKGKNCCGNVSPMSKDFLEIMDKVREESGGAITVNSGFRCRTHNTIIGGAPASKHMEGIALDCVSKVKTPHEIADIAQSYNLYTIVYETFTHIDGRYL